MRIRHYRTILMLPLVLAATWSLAADKAAPRAEKSAEANPPAAVPDDGVEAITKPSGDVRLAMTEPGLIARVRVKDGSPVKAGDVLIELDDALWVAQLEFAQAEAESTTRINAATATLDQKKVHLDRLNEVGRTATTPVELELAKLDVEIATRQLELERFVQAQNVRKVKELDLRIARMKMLSPIDGYVEQIAVKDGEALDAMSQVIRVVSVDPLWIDVPMPLGKAAALQKALSDGGDATVTVHFADAEGRWDAASACPGKVIHVAKVADGGSLARMVRVEVPNPAGRPAGEHVLVSVSR